MNEKPITNRLLTGLLQKIANEPTELVVIEGEDKLVTKAEALARTMWKMALGYIEERLTGEGVKTLIYKPDKSMIGAIFDRLEGKIVPIVDTTVKTRTIADKISEQSKLAINKIGNLNVSNQ